MLIDYHFHPNLSKNDRRARRKCQRIWQHFAEAKLDIVMVTEHVFKNPERAYTFLLAARPADATTIIFPGLEALTSEGIDIIVFAEKTSIFRHQSLLVPKQLGVQAMAHYVKEQPDLYGSIAHPCMAGHSGCKRRVGEAATIAAIRTIGGAEIHNSCFKGMQWLFDRLKITRLFPQRRRWMDVVTNLPKSYYEFPEVQLYTGGSDAHVTVEIGSGMIAPEPEGPVNAHSLFMAAAYNRRTAFHQTDVDIHLFLAVYKLYTIWREALVKAFRLYEGKLYQNDDQFTNYYSEAEKEAVLELRRQRHRLLRPFLNFLTYFGITPTLLNSLGIVAILVSVVFVWSTVPLAVFGFSLYLLTTLLVEPLARYQNVETERGAITKIILYILSLTAVVVSSIALEWMEPVWGTIYLALYILMLWMTITLNKLGQPIRLIVRSKPVLLLAILWYIATGINFITPVVMVFAWYMAMIDGVMLLRLRRAVA